MSKKKMKFTTCTTFRNDPAHLRRKKRVHPDDFFFLFRNLYLPSLESGLFRKCASPFSPPPPPPPPLSLAAPHRPAHTPPARFPGPRSEIVGELEKGKVWMMIVGRFYSEVALQPPRAPETMETL